MMNINIHNLNGVGIFHLIYNLLKVNYSNCQNSNQENQIVIFSLISFFLFQPEEKRFPSTKGPLLSDEDCPEFY